MVAYIDKVVGKLAAKLDELGIRDNTLILFTCDNGSAGAIKSQLNGNMVQGAKGTMTDAGTHVPLIASWPGTIPRARLPKTWSTSATSCRPFCEAAGAASTAGASDLDGQKLSAPAARRRRQSQGMDLLLVLPWWRKGRAVGAQPTLQALPRWQVL